MAGKSSEREVEVNHIKALAKFGLAQLYAGVPKT